MSSCYNLTYPNLCHLAFVRSVQVNLAVFASMLTVAIYGSAVQWPVWSYGPLWVAIGIHLLVGLSVHVIEGSPGYRDGRWGFHWGAEVRLWKKHRKFYVVKEEDTGHFHIGARIMGRLFILGTDDVENIIQGTKGTVSYFESEVQAQEWLSKTKEDVFGSHGEWTIIGRIK